MIRPGYIRPGWMRPRHAAYGPGRNERAQLELESAADTIMDHILEEAVREWAMVVALRGTAGGGGFETGRGWFPPVVRSHSPGEVIPD